MTHALSAFEQTALQEERDILYAEFIRLYNVMESGDWSVVGKNPRGYMSIEYEAAEAACDRAEKIISKYHK